MHIHSGMFDSSREASFLSDRGDLLTSAGTVLQM